MISEMMRSTDNILLRYWGYLREFQLDASVTRNGYSVQSAFLLLLGILEYIGNLIGVEEWTMGNNRDVS